MGSRDGHNLFNQLNGKVEVDKVANTQSAIVKNKIKREVTAKAK